MFDQSRGWLAALMPTAVPVRLTIIHNPASGRGNGRRMARYLAALQAQGCDVEVRSTGSKGDAETIAATLSASTGGVLVVAGGDGTINEVINGAPEHAPPIALLPLGTANVLHAELELPTDPVALAATIAAGATLRVQTPWANGRRFAVMAGAGFDAHVCAAVDAGTKRWLGRAAYVLGYLRTLLRFPFEGYDVIVDGVAYRAASVVIANAHYYGGRFSCAPDARIDEPDLQVCLFLRGGRWSAIRYGLSLLTGSLHRRPDVTILRARHVVVRGRPGEPVQCDGDIVTTLPLSVEADGRALQFVVPASRTRSETR